jgi:hypothetical protein
LDRWEVAADFVDSVKLDTAEEARQKEREEKQKEEEKHKEEVHDPDQPRKRVKNDQQQ